MEKGFTLIEILIAMAITGIIAAAIFTAYQSQQTSYITQENVAAMQQNLRAGLDIMIREIRMAGSDPQGIGGLGILDVRPKNTANSVDISVTGNSAIQISADFNGDGTLGGDETIAFSIFDFPVTSPNGKTDLARDTGSGRQLLASNIVALGMAYAFDADADGNIDTYSVGGTQQIIWAIDKNGDNSLDTNLDTDGDGDIDAADGPGAGGNGLITGQALTNTVPLSDIRAVRIWILAATGKQSKNFSNTRTYVVGKKVISPATDTDPANDNMRMRILETIIKCRNLGL